MKPNKSRDIFWPGILWLSLFAFFLSGCQSAPVMRAVTLPGFQPAPFDEQTISYVFEPETKVYIDAPQHFPANRKVKLIFYALPNGNTTEQTIGKLTGTNDDGHFDIQHIGAQTRFLRRVYSNEAIVVVYLESNQRSWPAWRKKHALQPNLVLQLVDEVKKRFSNFNVRVTLSAHSGGGSEIFGFINAEQHIPDDVERIAFLDANYAYNESLHHKEKLIEWLRDSNRHYLSVLAYNDAVALLNGTNFVSATGGTWGRTHAMLKDLGSELKFTSQTNAATGIETYAALNGRVEFLLKENPDQKIFHTVQVERNGFIQSLLSGTPHEGQDYIYFGDRAYTNWIATN
ncbi:MAG TPA: hypothetical protein VH413_19935 [Verrucomicrobiae bacterium]|jgi:hypothetical protein|nr:hypothetical protein [Verrucomicrobiae bacterium]